MRKSNSNSSIHLLHFRVFYDIVRCQRRVDVVVIYKNSTSFVWLELVPRERGFRYSHRAKTKLKMRPIQNLWVNDFIFFFFCYPLSFTSVCMCCFFCFVFSRVASDLFQLHNYTNYRGNRSDPLTRCLNICLSWFTDCVPFYWIKSNTKGSKPRLYRAKKKTFCTQSNQSFGLLSSNPNAKNFSCAQFALTFGFAWILFLFFFVAHPTLFGASPIQTHE